MKKEYKISFLIFFGFLFVLRLKIPFSTLLNISGINDINSDLIAGIAIRGISLIVLIYTLNKLSLIKFLGTPSSTNNFHSTFFALFIIAIGIKTNWNIYNSVNIYTLLLFFTSVILVGFLEEFVFRGAIFPLLMRSFRKKKQNILLSALLSSMLFGLIHYINLFSNPDNIIGISSQVFLAFAMGVYFCGLFLRTNNIIIPAVIHGMVNFAFGAEVLTNNIKNSSAEINENVINWSSIIPTAIVFSFIMGGGIYMIRKTDKENILKRLIIGEVLPPTSFNSK